MDRNKIYKRNVQGKLVEEKINNTRTRRVPSRKILERLSSGPAPSIGLGDFNNGGDTIMEWTINCGSAGSTSVSCSEGDAAGYTEGGSFNLGNSGISCTTTSDCHEHIA